MWNKTKISVFFHPSVQVPSDWAVPQSSRLKYRQLFNSHDKMMSGHLTGTHIHSPNSSICLKLEHRITSVSAASRPPGSHHPHAVQPPSGSAGHYMVSAPTFEWLTRQVFLQI